MPVPRARSLLADSGILVLANIAASGLGAVYVVATGRTLGPASYGDVTTLLSVGYLGALLLGPIEVGVSKVAAAAHGVGDRERLSALARGTNRRFVRIAMVLCLVWLPCAWGLKALLGVSDLASVVIFGVFQSAGLVAGGLRGVMRGDHRFRAFALNQTVEAVLRLGLGGLALLILSSATGAMLGYAAGIIGAVLIGFAQLRDLGPSSGRAVPIGDIVTFSAPLFFLYLYAQVLGNVDMIVAKRVLPETESGLYGAASTVARLLFMAATPVYQVLFSHVASLRARDEGSDRLAARSVLVMAILLGVSVCIPVFAAPELLTFLFKASFAGGAEPLRYLWIAQSLLVLQSTVGFVLIGTDRSRGFWAWTLPCVVQGTLLTLHHEDGRQVARSSLIAAVVGTALLAALLLANRSVRAPQPPSPRR